MDGLVALGVGDLDADDLVLEGAGLGGGDGALVALIRVLVQLVLGQAVLRGHHLGAHELAEHDAGIGRFKLRALVHAEAFLGGKRGREAHRHARHAFDTGGDDHIHRAAHHGLRCKMQGLLRGAALAIDAGGGHAFGKLGSQHGVARDIDRLFAHLADTAHDDIFHQGGIDLRAIHQRVQNLGREIHGVPACETATLFSARRARGRNNVSFRHDKSSVSGVADFRHRTGRLATGIRAAVLPPACGRGGPRIDLPAWGR